MTYNVPVVYRKYIIIPANYAYALQIILMIKYVCLIAILRYTGTYLSWIN